MSCTKFHKSKIKIVARGDEDCKKESENVNITPRESYMILDCFNYVLSKMGEEKIDYLFCNYSKEEIAKLGQRFGDVNLKNNW